MTPPATSRIRRPWLGCLLQLVLSLALSICIFWILWPADANVRWEPANADGSLKQTVNGSNTHYSGASIIQDGIIVIHTMTDIRFYNARDLTLIQQISIPAGKVFFSPDRSMFAAGYQSSSGIQSVHIHRAVDGVSLHELDNPPDETLTKIAWTADGRMLTICSSNLTTNRCRYWNSTTGTRIESPFPQPTNLVDIAYSPDGQFVYLSTPDTLIALHMNDGQEVFRRPLTWSKLTVSPDSSLILAYEAGNIRAFRASDGTLAWELGTDDSDRDRSLRFAKVSAVAISPNNQYGVVGETTTTGILGGVENGEIALIRIADGTIMRRYQGQTRGVGSMAFTPDSKTFLSSNGKEIARWDVVPLPPWLIWLPTTGLGLLFIYGMWQLVSWGRTR